jgi:hypothetical protein
MTPLSKWIRDCAEKLARRYYEGPTPPRRIFELVDVFAESFPNATRREWRDFAVRIAGEFYRSGYIRGYEWYMRDADSSTDAPDVLITAHDPDGAWLDREIVLSNPDNVPK